MAMTGGPMLGELRQEGPPRRRRRRRWPWVVAGVLVPAVAAGGVVWALRTEGSAEKTADAYLSAWSSNDYAAMKALVADPPKDFVEWHEKVRRDLKLERQSFTAIRSGGVFASDAADRGYESFGARLIGRGPDLDYEGELKLVEKDRRWMVAWTPATIHPELKPGRSLRLVTGKDENVPVLAAGGTRIDSADVPGSVQQIVAGLKAKYVDRLRVPNTAKINLYEDGDKLVKTLEEVSAAKRAPFQTTLDLRVHAAGAKALRLTKKPAALVALRPSTGEILAVVNNRGGFDRALMGKYPPGSTFKVVTASALVADGVSATQTVKCPAEQNIGGFPFHNAGYKNYGSLPFRDAFAHSCNTTFGAMTVGSLGASRLAKVAGDFGFGVPIDPGVPAVRADFPAAKDDTDLASASIGQGRVLASPLNMAAVAAAIASGTWRPPRLVPAELVPTDGEARRPLEDDIVKALRTLMPAVVSEGTAQAAPFPAGTAGKTGTAEYGSGKEPPAHSWFIGYKGDLAFSVIVEGGGAGSAVAAPIAAYFLNNLPTQP
ncbi:penicillin-binding transpeptidase domain-containing protein [Nonomuraea sp. NPDC050540]|uniref:penicillin-binding transpeptidase domain-containing protein n=1 Tax=Nonomuraea sp. NPDC050540 TaxID=3364367 RepID=UPI0037A6E685